MRLLQNRPLPDPRLRISTIAILTAAGVLFAIGIAALLLRERLENPTSVETRHITSAAYCCPKLSRDGKLFAYASGAGGGMMHIWIQQTAGGEPIQVTRGSDEEFSPDFSPDGTHIAFASSTGGLFVAPSLSGEPRLLAKCCANFPVYSPDGRQILFLGARVTVLSVDSGEQISPSLNRDSSSTRPHSGLRMGKKSFFMV